MPTSTRFAVAIHILSNIAMHPGQAVRSEDIARSVNTNPTVVRRILSTLADVGLTHAQMGQGGGNLLAKPANKITLLDIYQAVEEPQFFALHRSKPNPACYIGHNITPVLEEEFDRITKALEHSLAKTTLADIVKNVETCAGFPFVPKSHGDATKSL
ncbi:Rrf2 family transcriptional regulator [Solimicrobium silvestre]|uniref:Putative transcriptional regulator n=1 Tax=Solimicrobium silvestre TaxID=2099400 RepID=A0A2S9GX67_9BURK|nr:Rrf2 family transcriptional regulator [Solimicrobium silvestre]PRC92301.1 putative transcriptional regulator [Solimicrobium silvestre]